MTPLHSDALVFFGATGDLAYKKIFPAPQEMFKRRHLNVPVVGVAKAGWKLDQLKARARDSVEKHGGGLGWPAFEKLCGLLRYVDGDYKDSETFPTALALSSKSRLAGTWHRRRTSTRFCSAPSTRRQSSASTITLESGLCTTCFSSVLPTRSWSRFGIATISKVNRVSSTVAAQPTEGMTDGGKIGKSRLRFRLSRLAQRMRSPDPTKLVWARLSVLR